jgi:hypothetical protein
MHRTLKVAALASLASTALVAPAQAAKLSGVVVHENHRAHSFVIADRSGALRAVHSRRLPDVGSRVTVVARRLLNGTWRAERVRAGRRAHRALIRGTVTYINSSKHELTVSAAGVSLLVQEPPRRLHTVRRGGISTVRVGSLVTVDGSFEDGSVKATDVAAEGQDTNGIELEGTVQALDPSARTLSVSADDSEQSAATLTVEVPATFDLSRFRAGQQVELSVSANSDGTFTLMQSSDDEGAAGADDPEQVQTDDHGDASRGGERGGDGGATSGAGSTAPQSAAGGGSDDGSASGKSELTSSRSQPAAGSDSSADGSGRDGGRA